MTRRKLLTGYMAPRRAWLWAAIIISLFPIAPARACACCAEHGERHDLVLPIKDDMQDMLAQLRFADRANLYMTAAGWDDDVIRGIPAKNRAETYHLSVSLEKEMWSFVFKDDHGNRGKIGFAQPLTLHEYAVDQRPQIAQSSAYVPVELYKEWTLQAPLSPAGFFDRPTKGIISAKLILHGWGNGCTDAGQFANWTLEVSDRRGAKRSEALLFRFFGKLTSKRE